MAGFLIALLLPASLVQPNQGGLDVEASPMLQARATLVRTEFAKVEKNLLNILSLARPPSLLRIQVVAGSDGLKMSAASNSIGASYAMFPKKRYRFDLELARLALKSWGGEFREPIWGSALGDYICIEAVKRSGYYDDAFFDIRARYRKGLPADPDFRHVDLAGSVAESTRLAKGLWMLWQFQVRYPPDFIREYLRTRKAMAPHGAKTPDDVAAIVSRTAGTNQFPWFRFHGTKVSEKRTKLKF